MNTRNTLAAKRLAMIAAIESEGFDFEAPVILVKNRDVEAFISRNVLQAISTGDYWFRPNAAVVASHQLNYAAY